MVSYVICTTIGLALGLVLATIIIGLIMTTKLYRRIAMQIARNSLLSDDYNSIIKEIVEKSSKIAAEAATEIKEEDFKVNVATISNGDEA